jgi:AraC-like DNA-binding protein
VDEEYDFSALSYEYVRHEPALPFRTFFTSIGYRGFHWHRELELVLCVKGDLLLSKQDARLPLAEGDLVLLDSFEPHGLLRGRERNLLLVVQADPSAPELAAAIGGARLSCMPGLAGREEAYASIRSRMASIASEIAGREAGYELSCMEGLFSILKTLRREFSAGAKAGGARPERRTQELERLRTILEYLRDNAKDPIRLAEVASLVGLSPFYLSHFVKACTGLSFQENLAAIRTQNAVKLMLSTDARLIDIALEVGFSDIKYLNKAFKELFGRRPSELRTPRDRRALIEGAMHGRDLAEADLMAAIGKYLPRK